MRAVDRNFGSASRWPQRISGGRYPSLARLTSLRDFRNLHELPAFHVVDIAVYRNVIGNQTTLALSENVSQLT
jgi:hypothetical protein